jgi:hypothetical protein
MNTCEQTARLVIVASMTNPSREDAHACLSHVVECELCARELHANPETARVLLEHSHGTSHDPAVSLMPLHDEWLALGKVLAGRLSPATLERLSVPDSIDSLRYELRHSQQINTAAPTEIRCAVALTELAHAFESLVFQEEEGSLPPIVLTSGTTPVPGRTRRISIVVGTDSPPAAYFVERVMETISCSNLDADEIFGTLVALLQEGLLTLPPFTTSIDGSQVRLVHNETPHAAFGPREGPSSSR